MSKKLARRSFISRMSLAASSFLAMPALLTGGVPKSQRHRETIRKIRPMGFQWETLDPFLFCVHHEDKYPRGNGKMGPEASLEGRHLGEDFIIKDGFRMYHGKEVPGFPGHPHRGFETITVVREGMVDHSDSMGAAGRYGDGDVQWMTAGKGILHSEMFPLLKEDSENPLELFQIWLNLPRKNKLVEPHFKMHWAEDIPIHNFKDGSNRATMVEVMAGELDTHKGQTPPPDSWAADPLNSVAIFNIKMEPGATWTLPPAEPGLNRTLYFYRGSKLKMAGKDIPSYNAVDLESNREVLLENGSDNSGILMLQGKPIDEPVIQYGPFVMNTKEEIHQTFEEYNKTRFGGWPWPVYENVHPKGRGRFARHADGRLEERG